jgi:hypothetical protein
VDEDFYYVQSLILSATKGVPLMSVLEGGYNLDAIARSAVQCVRAQVEAFSQASDDINDDVVHSVGVDVGGGDDIDQDVIDLLSQLDVSENEVNQVDGGRNQGAEVSEVINKSSDLLDVVYKGYNNCLVNSVIRSDPSYMLKR